MRRALGIGRIGLAALAAASPTSAREVEYVAPVECPSREDAVRAVEARAREGRPATLSIHRHGGGYRGEVVLGDSEDRVARSVEARTCAAVVDALALIVALDAEESVVDVARETEPRSAEVPIVAPTRAEPRAAPERAPAPRARVDIGVGAAIGTSGFVEDPAWQGKVYSDVTASRPLGRTWLVPSARVAVTRAAGAAVVRGAVRADFALAALGVDACPLGVGGLDGHAVLALCARVEAGVLDAAAELEATRLWVAAGGALHHRFILGSPGTTSAFLDLDLAATTPLLRDRFVLPGEALITPSPVAWSAGIGGGVLFR